ncbi:hypothetical protein ID866_7912, partial [Astraeus odoratus]
MLTGTLPHLSQQNVFLGVPLLLMPEEVVLLVEKGFAYLVDDKKAHHDPSPSHLAKWDEARLEAIKHQLALAEDEQEVRDKRVNLAMSEEAVRKRRERELKRANDGLSAGNSELLSAPAEREEISVSRVIQESPGQNPPPDASTSAIAGAVYT